MKVNGQQKAKSFPPTADPSDIQIWREETRKKLKAQGPAKGTLAADIDGHLAKLKGQVDEGTLSARRYADANTWLAKWRSSPLADKARAEISTSDVEGQLLKFRARGGRRYGAESLNHLRQELINLWRTLDGKKHNCPAADVDKFEPPPPRKGFFERPALEKVIAALPSVLTPWLTPFT